MTAWAYVAEQDGCCLGVIAGDVPPKDLRRFYKDYAGVEIKPLADRAAWDEYRQRVPMFRRTPQP